MALQQLPAEARDQAVILFSAHSLPVKIVKRFLLLNSLLYSHFAICLLSPFGRGDPYPREISKTVELVMQQLTSSETSTKTSTNASTSASASVSVRKHLLAWQS